MTVLLGAFSLYFKTGKLLLGETMNSLVRSFCLSFHVGTQHIHEPGVILCFAEQLVSLGQITVGQSGRIQQNTECRGVIFVGFQGDALLRVRLEGENER